MYMQSKCKSISSFQLADSTAVAAESKAAGGSKSGLVLYCGASPRARTAAELRFVMLPGTALQIPDGITGH